MAKRTEAPYSVANFALLLEDRLGYVKCVDQACDPVMHWEKRRKVKSLPKSVYKLLPSHITFPRPEHEHPEYGGPVYDQNAIFDFLQGILGLTRKSARAQITAVMTITGQANYIKLPADDD